MLNQTMRLYSLQTLAVLALRAIHSWSGRHYRREQMRQALWLARRELMARRCGRGVRPAGETPAQREARMRQGNRMTSG